MKLIEPVPIYGLTIKSAKRIYKPKRLPGFIILKAGEKFIPNQQIKTTYESL